MLLDSILQMEWVYLDDEVCEHDRLVILIDSGAGYVKATAKHIRAGQRGSDVLFD